MFSGNFEVDVALSGGITAFTWNMESTNSKSFNAYEIILTVTADVPENTE